MTPESTSNPTGFRVKGWHVAVGVTAFFTIVVAVDASFAVLAYRTHPGQVSVTPYEDGLYYNRHIAQLKAQDRLGWRATAVAEPGVVTLVVLDRDGRPLEGLKVDAMLQRPATEAGRVAARFHEVQAGRYEATVGALFGAWDMTAEARSPTGVVFVAERRLTWP